MTRAQQLIWILSKYVLSDLADFDEPTATFDLLHSPRPEIARGRYRLVSKQDSGPGCEDFIFRLTHPIGEYVTSSGKAAETPSAELVFNGSGHPTIISLVAHLVGKAGWMSLDRMVLDAFDRQEQLLFTAFQHDGTALDQETCEKLMICAAVVERPAERSIEIESKLKADKTRRFEAAVASAVLRNEALFREQSETLERWARDVTDAAEREMDLVKAQVAQAKRNARKAVLLEDKAALERKVRDLENARSTSALSSFGSKMKLRRSVMSCWTLWSVS